MGLYLYKASPSPDLYPHLFLIFFMHFSSPLDPSHLNFKLLSILSLEENLWMANSPTMVTFTANLLFLTQTSSQISYLAPLLLTTHTIKFWLLSSIFH